MPGESRTPVAEAAGAARTRDLDQRFVYLAGAWPPPKNLSGPLRSYHQADRGRTPASPDPGLGDAQHPRTVRFDHRFKPLKAWPALLTHPNVGPALAALGLTFV